MTVNGGKYGQVTVDDNGAWEATVTGLREGPNTIIIEIENRKGIKNSRHHKRSVFVDTVPLKRPVIHYPEDGSSVNKASFKISINADTRAETIVFIDDKQMPGTVSTDETGSGTYLLREPLIDGFHELLAVSRYLDEDKKSEYVVFQIETASPD